ncbi:hypothetical protein BDM02DRAFT_3096895, partial [Thelephora ganbajun]
HHDWFTTALSSFLCFGLVVSYLPQHLRIILAKSSEGFSPWFLLLGSTSCASGMLNLFVKQWDVVKCCKYISAGSCLESSLGIIQTFIQWFFFTIILALYMIYYPQNLKYIEVYANDGRETGRNRQLKITKVKTDNWSLSITLSWVVFIHIVFVVFVTFYLLGTTVPGESLTQLELWATFLGVSSATLAALQYAPQIVHTYRMKLVGALSIPMMLIQTPGAIFMVLSIALRPGTNWTSWVTYAVAGIMQGMLLAMCIIWKLRQSKLRIDDFGNSLDAGYDVVGGITISGANTDSGTSLPSTPADSDIDEMLLDPSTEPSERTPLLPNPDASQRKWWQRN